jgi:hypothetical protein
VTSYLFDQFVAIDSTGNPVANAEFEVYARNDTAYTTPLAAFDAAHVPLAAITSNALGVVQPYRVNDHPDVVIKSGTYTLPQLAISGVVDAVADAVTSAQTAQTAAQTAAVAAQEAAALAAGTVFPGGAEGQVWGKLSDTDGDVGWVTPEVSTGGPGGGDASDAGIAALVTSPTSATREAIGDLISEALPDSLAIGDVSGLTTALATKVPINDHDPQVDIRATAGSARSGDLDDSRPTLVFVLA